VAGEACDKSAIAELYVSGLVRIRLMRRRCTRDPGVSAELAFSISQSHCLKIQHRRCLERALTVHTFPAKAT